MTVHDFIKERKRLIWRVRDYDKLNTEAIVEATLNYGDWEDVQAFIRILGINTVAEIFRRKSKPSRVGRQNYAEKTRRFFTAYFDKHAQGNFHQ